MGNRIVEPAVQGAKLFAVRFQPERASLDAPDRIHGIYHLEHANRLGRTS